MDARLASCVGSGSRSSGGSSSLAQHVRGRWTDEMSEMHEMEGSTQLGGRAGLWAGRVEWSRSDGALYGVPLPCRPGGCTCHVPVLAGACRRALARERLGSLTNHPKPAPHTLAPKQASRERWPAMSDQMGEGASLPACQARLTDEGRPD